MSQYYKQIRKIFFKRFKYLGIIEKVSVSLYTLFAALLLFSVFSIIFSSNQKITFRVFCFILFVIVIFLIILGFLCSHKKNYYTERTDTINYIADILDNDKKLVDMLIQEITRYIKKVHTFSTWIIGISITFLVLFITIFANCIQKLTDIIIKVSTIKELNNFISDFNALGVKSLTIIFEIIILLLIIVSSTTVLCYCLLGLITFDKKQILTILYDVQYQLYMTEKQKNNLTKEVQNATWFKILNAYINSK